MAGLDPEPQVSDADEPRSLNDAGWRAAEAELFSAALEARAARRAWDQWRDPYELTRLQLALSKAQSAAREATVQIRAARRAGALPQETEEPTEEAREKGQGL